VDRGPPGTSVKIKNDASAADLSASITKVLAEERRLARVQALEWSREVKMESGEKRERKSKNMRKVKAKNGRGTKLVSRRRKKCRKLRKEGGGDVNQALFSNGEGERPSKKVGSRPFSTRSQPTWIAHRQEAPD
jgi:hypothetical protein